MNINDFPIELAPHEDCTRWLVRAEVAKWAPEQVAALADELGHEPTGDELSEYFKPELVTIDGNMLLTAGLALFMNRAIGTPGTTAIDNTHTRIGVGDSSAAEAAGQTDLQAGSGATHRFFMTMDSGYPGAAGGVLTARATFASGDANFPWAEWGIDVTTATAASGTTVGNTLVNRKVASLGTKVSGAVWQFTVAITLA